MAGEARDSDRILTEARRSLNNQRAGGRRVRAIGETSRRMRREHTKAKAARMITAVVTILVAAMALGLVVNGIGWEGIIVTVMAVFAALYVFGRFPRMETPKLGQLNTGDASTLVGNTEMWLEAQRPALPAPAVQLVDQLGGQLDALGKQLQSVDNGQPQVAEVRKLVGEYLPEVVASYTAIPAHLRSVDSGGRVPERDLVASLGKISAEIDSVTRQLADGEIDKLAIRSRYLDYKYGGETAEGAS